MIRSRWQGKMRLGLASGLICLVCLGALISCGPATAQALSSESTVSVGIGVSSGNIRLVGDAFPGALVTFLQDGVVAGTQTANSNSGFDITFSGLTAGTYTYSIYALDSDGKKTLTISFSVGVIVGVTTTISGIILPAIITVPSTHKRPATITESGRAKNNSTVTTFTKSDTITKQTTADSLGRWSTKISDILHLGGHSASALVSDGNGNQSALTESQQFQVILSADLNLDELTNLTDFSILMFSYSRNPPPNLAADINDSGNAPDLVDFSIMMFYWSR